ncbi:hypothetical protein FRX31_034794 [Thalictrum thalictroides]|uniref:Uncharacterized protein n=1 Tax=Thalictrum thalictroides TaxID=46969 RepID=A0A7J6UTN6_THATH|nr:hypothetical protein FRX31_034794 [Thalictrum thalictroides]
MANEANLLAWYGPETSKVKGRKQSMIVRLRLRVLTFSPLFHRSPLFHQPDGQWEASELYSTRLYWASTGSGHTCQLTFIVDSFFIGTSGRKK